MTILTLIALTSSISPYSLATSLCT